MLVSVTGLGSLWRHKFGKDQNDHERFTRGVFFNTTGVRVARMVRQRPKIVGYARFHQCGGFDPRHPSRILGRVFDCAEPSVWKGENKLLFHHVLRKAEAPERFLVVVRSESIGAFRAGTAGWRSPDTWLVSLSEHGRVEEAMLLMSADAWITTELGRFVLVQDPDRPWLARLILTNCPPESTTCGT